MRSKSRLISGHLLCIFSIAVAVAATAESTLAQGAAAAKYDEIPIDPKWTDDTPQGGKALRSGRERLVRFVFSGSEPFEENRQEFTEWFTDYYFRLMTHKDHLAELPKDRETFQRYLSTTSKRDVHDAFVELVLNSMSIIARGNYHPVVRYNAMLLIGELNSQEAVMFGEKRQAVPLISALALMLTQLDSPQQIDAVRVAALVGIFRHVRIDRELQSGRRLIGNNAETRIVDVMASLINQQDAPEGRSQQGHDWMRRRAMEILGELGVVGQDGKVAKMLQSVLSDEKQSIAVRCTAAEALGNLDFGGNFNVDSIAKDMGELAATACYAEIKRVEDLEARERESKESRGIGRPGGYGGASPMGAFGAPTLGGPAPEDPLSYRVDVSRRRIKHELLCVQRGLTGPNGETGLKAVAGENGEYVQKVVDGVQAIAALADNESFVNVSSFLTDVKGQVKRFETDCEIVVQLPSATGDAVDLLTNPLGGADGDLGSDPLAPINEPPASTPAAKTAPKKPLPKTKPVPAENPFGGGL